MFNPDDMWHGDVDETIYKDIKTACPKCGRIIVGNVVGESLAMMDKRADGVYVEESECYDCLINN